MQVVKDICVHYARYVRYYSL